MVTRFHISTSIQSYFCWHLVTNGDRNVKLSDSKDITITIVEIAIFTIMNVIVTVDMWICGIYQFINTKIISMDFSSIIISHYFMCI